MSSQSPQMPDWFKRIQGWLQLLAMIMAVYQQWRSTPLPPG